MAKKSLIFFYVVLIVCMAAATIVEKYNGTDFVHENIYGTWWFSFLWASGVAVAIFYFLKMNVRRPSVVALHLSFVVILAGAFLTKATARKGFIHLREGETTEKYVVFKKDMQAEIPLPFSIRLEKFETSFHDGTSAAADYISHVEISDSKKSLRTDISMNNIFSRKGIRLYQSGYDNDGKGTTIIVSNDRWGIPVTYAGYALLFFSLFWMLVDPKGAYRNILRRLKSLPATAIVVALMLMPSYAHAVKVLPKTTADRVSRLYVVYNNRVCPMQTLALDFTKKIYGHRHYKDYTPEQVLTGFMFYPEEWAAEPIIKVKNADMRRAFGLNKYTSLNSFFNSETGNYILGPAVDEYQQGNNDKMHKAAADIDDKLMLMLVQVGRAHIMKIDPAPLVDSVSSSIMTQWLSPIDRIPAAVEPQRKEYIENSFQLLIDDAQAGNYERMDKALDKILLYQTTYGGKSIPSALRTKAERIYNAVPFATILFMFNLTMGFVTLFYFIYRLYRKDETTEAERTKKAGVPLRVAWTLLLLSFIALTVCLVLRWIISGTVPMANGYETMLLMAWLIMLVSLPIYRKFNIILTFSFLLSGFFLLVSHISQMDPKISHVMPVLSSPLLTIHVSIIMMAYALLALTFICGLMAIVVNIIKANSRQTIESYRLLSELFLYPALTCLGLGIFIGAIWANISWGTYWSWDPKETWALITFMVYAVTVHNRSLPWLRNPMTYHVYMTLAFMTILMTYFGVNYFLGGMHGYA